MNKRNFLKNLAGATLGAAAVAALPAEAKTLAKHLPASRVKPIGNKKIFPNVPLVTHEGKVVRFYDDLVKNKTVMINFMFAQCGDICPGMTANLKQVQKEFGDRVGKDIFMYSITLAPEHDTPEVLKAYTELFHIQPGWTFLTGKKSNIELLRKELGFSFSDPNLDKDKTQHIGVVKYGIEPLQRWGTCPALGDPKFIAEYVRWMEPNGSRPNIAEILA
jgi:protein SCO1/2